MIGRWGSFGFEFFIWKPLYLMEIAPNLDARLTKSLKKMFVLLPFSVENMPQLSRIRIDKFEMPCYNDYSYIYALIVESRNFDRSKVYGVTAADRSIKSFSADGVHGKASGRTFRQKRNQCYTACDRVSEMLSESQTFTTQKDSLPPKADGFCPKLSCGYRIFSRVAVMESRFASYT